MPAPVVLIVERSAELRRMLEESLRHRGYDVATADDAEEAGALLRRKPADLLIADPSADDVAERRRIDALCEEFPRVPSIVVSPDGFDPAIFTPPLDGEAPRRLLRRPFTLGELLMLTERLLPKHQPDRGTDPASPG